jgi:GntR family trehalose operon transcriptional repressor
MHAKYISIYKEILSKIEGGEISSGTFLPSESELMKKYDVSRDTIRKSLDLLAKNGFIEKVKGKGSLVLDIHKLDFPVSNLVSFKELAEKMDNRVQTILVDLELISPDKQIMKDLNISKEENVWKVIRIREIDKEKIILDKDYIVEGIVPDLTKDICMDSIYEYVEEGLGLQISFAKKEVTVQNATKEDRKYLDLDDSDMVVIVKNYVYLSNAILFQYTESRHRPDKFRFVDFARRGY